MIDEPKLISILFVISEIGTFAAKTKQPVQGSSHKQCPKDVETTYVTWLMTASIICWMRSGLRRPKVVQRNLPPALVATPFCVV